MKIYKVKVNGKEYVVELESLEENNKHIESAPVNAAPQASGDGVEFKAPMAGTILDVKVCVGQSIKAGDVLCILEAMKLENEVVSDVAGVIKEVKVSKGTQVTNGQVIFIIG